MADLKVTTIQPTEAEEAFLLLRRWIQNEINTAYGLGFQTTDVDVRIVTIETHGNPLQVVDLEVNLDIEKRIK